MYDMYIFYGLCGIVRTSPHSVKTSFLLLLLKYIALMRLGASDILLAWVREQILKILMLKESYHFFLNLRFVSG